MNALEGGRRTRIRKHRSDRDKRPYKSRSWEDGEFIKDKYPINGNGVIESAARVKINLNQILDQLERE